MMFLKNKFIKSKNIYISRYNILPQLILFFTIQSHKKTQHTILINILLLIQQDILRFSILNIHHIRVNMKTILLI